jgi:hypothetical protein
VTAIVFIFKLLSPSGNLIILDCSVNRYALSILYKTSEVSDTCTYNVKMACSRMMSVPVFMEMSVVLKVIGEAM